MNKGIHTNTTLQGDWNKYGEDCFKFQVIRECDKKELKYAELEEIFNCDCEMYNNSNIKDQIVWMTTNIIKDLDADFEVDYKNDECSIKKPLNFNVFGWAENDKEVYLSIRNVDFIDSEDKRNDYELSRWIKSDYVLGRKGKLIEVEYWKENKEIVYDVTSN